MSTEYYIIDNPNPASQDFTLLKNEGLSYIQEVVDNDWTNLNASDPGITILDQLCYALTELGYCNDFPMADILTQADGNLPLEDHFYLPENILTTTPVTVNDIRKYIIDGVDGVDNLVVVPIKNHQSGIVGIFQLYLLINSYSAEQTEIDNLCKAAFFQANKARNLGEIFLMPLALTKATRQLQGKLAINNQYELSTILAAIQMAINEYIFPSVKTQGYERLVEKNQVNEIFNGPLLSKGWMQDSSLGKKKNKLRSTELAQVINAVPGVISISNLLFTQQTEGESQHWVECNESEILFIDLLSSAIPPPNSKPAAGMLVISCNGKQLSTDLLPVSLSTVYTMPENNILYGASVKNQTNLPVGKFRDINSYYSIQHTFPEIFRVGIDALVSNATDFQIAQSRQLKGYLTLFDQVLANQFSQLAGLGQLFSFKNATCAAPADRQAYFAFKDTYEKANPLYPVPFRNFSPTYFYQSLYHVPNIRPLLKNADVFEFSLDPNESNKVLINDSWIEYQRDPYNSYMKGLMDFMEDEKINVQRRNEILDHLLARHGESPLLIETYIEGSLYTGDSMKDKVIFKSLYLQNIGLLSYYRQKGHNFMGAHRISADIPKVSQGFEKRIFGWDSSDFVIDSEKIDNVEKLEQQDFIDFAAIELKVSLLFGLKAQYKNFISTLFAAAIPESLEISTALWLIEQRRGFIFLETSLLNFYAISSENADPNAEQNGTPFLVPNELIFIFPSFIANFTSPAFQQRLDCFIENEIPVRLQTRCYFLEANQIQRIIPAFTDWHNCLVYNKPDHCFNKWLTKSARELINQLIELTTTVNV